MSYRRFSVTLAVDNVTFDVKNGKIFGLLEPNGAGKPPSFSSYVQIAEITFLDS